MAVGREGLFLEQPPAQPVDVANWKADEEFGVYPEGARDKSLLYSPAESSYPFLAPNHRYLFKHSFERYPDQFWAEVIAYRVGCLLGVPVPPVFVAFDSDNNVCGALVEWFLNYPGAPDERYVPGGDIMVGWIEGYDRKRGTQHNFKHVKKYHNALKDHFDVDWLDFWCDMLLFDALIGNNDRHQDNWGLLWHWDDEEHLHVRPAPVFDNGTSLGYEIIERKMPGFADRQRLANYVNRGRHHIRWNQADEAPQQHVELIGKLIADFPRLRDRIAQKLETFDINAFTTMIRLLTDFEVPVPLSGIRADFIVELTLFRHKNLINQLVESDAIY